MTRKPAKWSAPKIRASGPTCSATARPIQRRRRLAQPSLPVRVTAPDGDIAVSSSPDFAPMISAKLGRPVTLLAAPPPQAQLEEYWPDMEELSNRDVVTDEAMPPGTFFDLAILHLLTTGTLDQLRELNSRSRFEPRRFRPT